MTAITIHRVAVLPQTLEASSIYIVRGADSVHSDLYFTGNDGTEIRHSLTKPEVEAMITAAGVGGGGAADSADTLTTPRLINGVAFDGSADIVINAVDITPRIAATEKGVANGVATLDTNGLVPTSQLPSYVDKIVEVATLSALPVSGDTGKIYVVVDTNKIYRWSGSTYIEISPTAGTADAAVVLANARSITATGDVTWTVSFDGSGNVTGAATLADTGIVAGEYAVTTVNSKGLATAGRALVAADIPALDYTKVSSAASIELAGSEW